MTKPHHASRPHYNGVPPTECTEGLAWRVLHVDWRVLRVTKFSFGLFWNRNGDQNPNVTPAFQRRKGTICIEPLHSLSSLRLSHKTLCADSLIGRSGKGRTA